MGIPYESVCHVNQRDDVPEETFRRLVDISILRHTERLHELGGTLESVEEIDPIVTVQRRWRVRGTVPGKAD